MNHRFAISYENLRSFIHTESSSHIPVDRLELDKNHFLVLKLLSIVEVSSVTYSQSSEELSLRVYLLWRFLSVEVKSVTAQFLFK